MDAYEGRIRFLNDAPIGSGPFVVYWMQHAQRAVNNHALEFAISQANSLGKPLVVFFGLTNRYPHASERQYAFMVEGLQDCWAALSLKRATFTIALIDPVHGIIQLARQAALVVVDAPFVRIERQWRQQAASSIACCVIQVETDTVVPVETASTKEEYSAATLRRKLTPLIPSHAVLPESSVCHVDPVAPLVSFATVKLETMADVHQVVSLLDIDRSVPRSRIFTGGYSHAVKRLRHFLSYFLSSYGSLKGDPSKDVTSRLSPYLHFGQISPIEVLQAATELDPDDTSGFVEELTVRRELAVNFCRYQEAYDSMDNLPAWARATLEKHRFDRRPQLYPDAVLEAGRTGDPYWNAAQRQLVETGFMHGYMRMYWGKKILEWKEDPAHAYVFALRMNDTYGLDGRDPNGYAGIAWCFGKHDRPWGEREVFGMVRYMNDRGLERKFDMAAYVKMIGSSSPGPKETESENR